MGRGTERTAEAAQASDAIRRIRRREAIVTHAAVLAVAIASLGAALSRPAGSSDARQGAAVSRVPSRCATCGVVESVMALQPADGFEVRIRMDDGSLRSVPHRAWLSPGSRVLPAGHGLRVLRLAGQQG